MLEKHLVAKTEPIARTENIVCFGDYRVTVLFDRLFRVEKNRSREFNDAATQSVWYRNMPAVGFDVKDASSYVEIKTEKVTLHLAKSLAKSYVLIHGKKVPLDNEGNLLGTTRTLDMHDGDVCIRDAAYSKLQLGTGVCSRSGVAFFDDARSLRLMEDGRLCEKSSDELDLYVFAFGNEYREAVKALYAITGATPLLPRFAFGNWWSRYHAYTDEEYLYIMDKFDRFDVPLTVATVDMDWHYSNHLDEQKGITASGKATEDRGTTQQGMWLGWTGYSWNTDLFPDYKNFLEELHKRNLKVTLNLHPADGVRYFEDMYEEMATAMGIDPTTEKQVEFDIADSNFVNNYFKILHHPYEKDGVDFWWVDWQQGTKSKVEGLDPLWALNHYHFLDNGRDGKHALLMSRYAGVGSHRYPMGFSGDTAISWATLAYLPYFTATSTNIGYTWWGHDFGGHHMGVRDNELYLRFMQFAVFNPIMRMHCTDSIILTQEPWAHENGAAELAREALRLRHRMIPFLHSANHRSHADGLGLMEPMYYEYPECEESYRAKDQYIFAGELVVAPITEHSSEGGLTKKDVWLPEGVWTDIFTNDVYRVGQGGAWIKMVRPLNSIPALAREGAVIPTSRDRGNSFDNPAHLEAAVYAGNRTYRLYEDNEKGTAAYTVFENSTESGKQTLRVSFEGDVSVLPKKRSMTFVFKSIVVNTAVDARIGLTEKQYARVEVKKNGKPIEVSLSKYAEVEVTVTDIDYSAVYEITVTHSVLSPLSELKREVLLKLLRVEGAYSVRRALASAVRNVSGKEELRGAIMVSDVSQSNKLRLSETIL